MVSISQNLSNFFYNRDLFSYLSRSVHLWKIEINNDTYNKVRPYFISLSKKERERFHAYAFEREKKIFLVTHVVLRFLITYYTHIPYNAIKYGYNRYNKPYLVHDFWGSRLFFNISHSKEKALIAINDKEIGVDVEHMGCSIDLDELSQLIFSSTELKEYLEIKNNNKKSEYFYSIWTKKEAYLKAISFGLIDDLRSINVSREVTALKSLDIKIRGKFFMEEVRLSCKAYKAAVSYKSKKIKTIELFAYQ